MLESALRWCVLMFVLLSAVGAERSQAQPATYLPWQYGANYTVTQGNDGGYSHNDAYTRFGWDFGLPSGTPVISSAGGTVRVAASGYNYGWGNTVTVCYADGTCSRYGHLSSYVVRPGEGVSQGQLLGYSGNTGDSTGPHLHYQLENTSGAALRSSFVEAGVPVTGQTVTSRNSGNPRFSNVVVHSSGVLDVTAGDQVRAVVTAKYEGPRPIPCGHANLGTRDGSPARFADYRAGAWPASPWRGSDRAAAAECYGNLDPGETGRWELLFHVPADTAPGMYLTGRYGIVWEGTVWSDVSVPISLRVLSRYQAKFVSQEVTPLVEPGGTGRMAFVLKNIGRSTWTRSTVFLGTKGDAPFTYGDAGWGTNRNRLVMEEDSVAPGETARFTGSITVPASTAANHRKQYMVPVVEGKEWFGEEIGIYADVFVGDAEHLPYDAADYGAEWVSQTNVSEPLASGDTATVTMTWRNTGTAVWFKKGQSPVALRATHPRDRTSQFVDPDGLDAIVRKGVRLPVDRVNPGETAMFELPVEVADEVQPGSYQEYFRPVAEGMAWFGRDDAWWPFRVSDPVQ